MIMFCPKCGNQVADNEKFCGKCGAMLQAAPQAQQQPVQQPTQPQGSPYAARPYPEQPQQGAPMYQQNPYQQAPMRPAVDPKAAGSIKILYLIVVVTGLLSAFLWFGKGVYASAMGLRQTGTFHQMCAGGGEFLSVLNVIIGILIAVLSILPVLTNTAGKPRKLVGIKIFAILQVLAVVMVLLAAEGTSSGLGGMVSWGLTGLGYFHLLTVLANIVIPYMISSKAKKL